jgi:hypothetical protein
MVAVNHRHLAIHQDDIESLAAEEGAERDPPHARDHDLETDPMQHSRRQH